MEPPPTDNDWLKTESAERAGRWDRILGVFAVLMGIIILGMSAYVITMQVHAAHHCEDRGGVWAGRPGACMAPLQDQRRRP
jgi:hypothetical protein